MSLPQARRSTVIPSLNLGVLAVAAAGSGRRRRHVIYGGVLAVAGVRGAVIRWRCLRAHALLYQASARNMRRRVWPGHDRVVAGPVGQSQDNARRRVSNADDVVDMSRRRSAWAVAGVGLGIAGGATVRHVEERDS